MKVEILEGTNKGNIVEYPEDIGAKMISDGFAREVPEPAAQSGQTGSGPAMKIPIKYGSGSWFELTLWPPRPAAPEKWKHHSGLTVSKKVRPESGGLPEVKEEIHLTPNQALGVGSAMAVMGIEGKKLDQEAKA